MVSTSPRLSCSSGSRLSEDEKDKAGAEAEKVRFTGQEGGGRKVEGKKGCYGSGAGAWSGGAWFGCDRGCGLREGVAGRGY